MSRRPQPGNSSSRDSTKARALEEVDAGWGRSMEYHLMPFPDPVNESPFACGQRYYINQRAPLAPFLAAEHIAEFHQGWTMERLDDLDIVRFCKEK